MHGVGDRPLGDLQRRGFTAPPPMPGSRGALPRHRRPGRRQVTARYHKAVNGWVRRYPRLSRKIAGPPPSVTAREVLRDVRATRWPAKVRACWVASTPLIFRVHPRPRVFPPPHLFALADLEPGRIEGRRVLRDRLDRRARADVGGPIGASTPTISGTSTSPRPGRSAGLRPEAEPPRGRDTYGPPPFGRGFLLARHLVVMGVRRITAPARMRWRWTRPAETRTTATSGTYASNWPRRRTWRSPAS